MEVKVHYVLQVGGWELSYAVDPGSPLEDPTNSVDRIVPELHGALVHPEDSVLETVTAVIRADEYLGVENPTARPPSCGTALLDQDGSLFVGLSAPPSRIPELLPLVTSGRIECLSWIGDPLVDGRSHIYRWRLHTVMLDRADW